MKAITEYITEAIFKDFTTMVINQIIHKAKRSSIQVKDKKITMEALIKYDSTKIKTIEKNKDANQLIKDITNIVNKDVNSFKAVLPLLQKWIELNEKNKFYPFDKLIDNEKCKQYLIDTCKTLTDEYGWESFSKADLYINGNSEENNEEQTNDNEVNEEYILYNVAFIAFILSSISDNIS